MSKHGEDLVARGVEEMVSFEVAAGGAERERAAVWLWVESFGGGFEGGSSR